VRRRAAEGSLVLPKALACLALPAVAVVAAHVAINLWRFGTWLRSPYIDQIQFFTGSILVGIRGFLFSPAGSIFVYSPLLLLLPLTVPSLLRRQRAECVTVLALAATYVIACSKNEDWTGLYSAPGPRFLFSLTPFLMLPLGPWLDAASGHARRWSVGALAFVGLVVQILSMSAHWGNTIEIMQWRAYDPPLSFVWHVRSSPLAGSIHAIAQGSIDSFPWKLLVGAPGIEAAPASAVALMVAWAGLLALAARRLTHAVRAQEAS
jgi:hypothetical protein